MDDRGGRFRWRRAALFAVGLSVGVGVSLTGCAPTSAPTITSHTYTSTAGTDSTGQLAWIAATPLVLSFDDRDGRLQLGMKTPCNGLSAPATVTDRQISIDRDRLAATAMGCLGPEGGYEAWATAFIQKPMSYVLSGDTLTVTTDDAEVVFAETT